MKTIVKIVSVLIVLLLTLTAIQCAKDTEDENKITICFAFQDLETEAWVASHEAITTKLREKNINVIERNANEDANRQFEQIRSAIVQDVDGIILIPQDGESAVTIIGEANKAGIPIGVFNRPPVNKSNPAIAYIGVNFCNFINSPIMHWDDNELIS